MSSQFGPWATSIDAGANPQLSSFWKKRLTMLAPASRTVPAFSWPNWLGLGVLAALMVVLPTIRTISAAANEERPNEVFNQISEGPKTEKIEQRQPVVISNRVTKASAAEIDNHWRWLFGRELTYDPTNQVPIEYAKASLNVAEAELKVNQKANEIVRGSVPRVIIKKMELDVELRKQVYDYYLALKRRDEKAASELASRYAKTEVDLAQAELLIQTEANRRVPGSVLRAEIKQSELQRELAEIAMEKVNALQKGDEKILPDLDIRLAKKKIEYQQIVLERDREANRRKPGSISEQTFKQTELELELAKIDLEVLTIPSSDEKAKHELSVRHDEIKAQIKALHLPKSSSRK